MGRIYADFSWDFREADTKMYTHCFHAYPAMMIPQVTGRIIDLYGKNAELLFDPYCGTGTSLVEANLRGINAVGTDLNPLARLIAKVKTTPLDPITVKRYIGDFNNYIFSLKLSKDHTEIEVPTFKNINYWFSDKVQRELAIIKRFIDSIDNTDIADFFRVAFSITVRESSWTRNGEFKLFRMNERQMEKFNPDTFKIMNDKLNRNLKGLEMYVADRKGNAISQVCDFNTVEGIPEKYLSENSVDIIVTSPPYGDSHTTVAYGQFSRLANQWLGFEGVERLDNKLMGGLPVKDAIEFKSSDLSQMIEQLSAIDKKRCYEVVSFYKDYQDSINNVSKVVKPGGYACYVVGNRRVKGLTLPTDVITSNFFAAYGFTHVETIIRNIPNKRMPSKNSPTNVPGALETTMNNEYIVIMKKD